MRKLYIVRLSKEEREILLETVKNLKGSSQKAKRANILLQADVEGPNWKDRQIAEAYRCRTRTVENVRKTLVREGFLRALNGKKREEPPRKPKFDKEQEARVIALRLGDPPEGFANWSLRLLADKVVELGIVGSVDPTTVGKVFKKRDEQTQDPVLGHPSGRKRRVRSPHGERARDLRPAV